VQSKPIPNNEEPVFKQVIRDIEKRAETGKASYGTYLQPFNGRSAAQDLYEELIDAALYIKQLMIERKSMEKQEIVKRAIYSGAYLGGFTYMEGPTMMSQFYRLDDHTVCVMSVLGRIGRRKLGMTSFGVTRKHPEDEEDMYQGVRVAFKRALNVLDLPTGVKNNYSHVGRQWIHEREKEGVEIIVGTGVLA
jgi:hypothetical protein